MSRAFQGFERQGRPVSGGSSKFVWGWAERGASAHPLQSILASLTDAKPCCTNRTRIEPGKRFILKVQFSRVPLPPRNGFLAFDTACFLIVGRFRLIRRLS